MQGRNTLMDHWIFRYLPWAILLTHAWLALTFAQERILNTDCSYQLFSSVNDRSFFFQESRYGMLPTQIPVVLGILLQWPMKWLVIIYSVSFPLVYGLIIWLNQRVLHAPEAALAKAATLMLGWGSTFFHCTTETHLLLAASVLLYGTYQAFGRDTSSLVHQAVPLMVSLWCLSIHPNALFTVGFVAVLAWLRGLASARTLLPAVGLVVAYTLAAMLMAEKGSYDADKYQTLLGGLGRIPHITDLAAVWFLKEWVGGQYLVPLIMAGVVIIFGRSWRVAAFMTVSVLVFVLITILTFPDGDSLAMMEKSYLPALFMIVLAFCTALPRMRFRRMAIVLVCVGAIHSVYTIQEAGLPYSRRLEIMRALIDGPGGHTAKMIIRETPYKDTPLVLNNWALSMDAMIMSRCMGPIARTIFMDDAPDRWLVERGGNFPFLYTSWNPNGMQIENRAYFNLPDEPYALVGLP